MLHLMRPRDVAASHPLPRSLVVYRSQILDSAPSPGRAVVHAHAVVEERTVASSGGGGDEQRHSHVCDGADTETV